MGYHAIGACVAAQPPALSPPLSRERSRHLGAQFVAVLQREIDAAMHACDALPEPKQLLKDLTRGRAASAVTYGAALASLVVALPPERFERLGLMLWAHLASLRGDTEPCVLRAWDHSTAAQAAADLPQARAVRSLDTGDLIALTVAAEHTATEIAHDRRLLTALHRRMRQVRAAGGV